MCNCRKEMCNKIKDRLYPDAEHVSSGGVEILSGRTFSVFEVRLPGKKKPEEVRILHSFCPYCGEPYPKEDAQ